jgi:hypothetical protein
MFNSSQVKVSIEFLIFKFRLMPRTVKEEILNIEQFVKKNPNKIKTKYFRELG